MPTEYRRCQTCGVEKPLTAFYADKNRALGRGYVCKVCTLAATKTAKAREVRRARAAARYREARAVINAMKDRPCADCGGRFPPCAMDFDHPDPKHKAFTVADVAGGGLTPKLLAEIAKTQIICSNCHRVRTERQVELGIIKRGGRPRKPVIG